jgi:hypothetical protein
MVSAASAMADPIGRVFRHAAAGLAKASFHCPTGTRQRASMTPPANSKAFAPRPPGWRRGGTGRIWKGWPWRRSIRFQRTASTDLVAANPSCRRGLQSSARRPARAAGRAAASSHGAPRPGVAFFRRRQDHRHRLGTHRSAPSCIEPAMLITNSCKLIRTFALQLVSRFCPQLGIARNPIHRHA